MRNLLRLGTLTERGIGMRPSADSILILIAFLIFGGLGTLIGLSFLFLLGINVFGF